MATVLVTGANRGIGLALSRLFEARGDRVIAVCRSTSSDLEDLGVEMISGVEVTSESSIAGLVKSLRGRSVDILLHNAGILRGDSLEKLDLEGLRQQMEVNAFAPLRLTAALLPNLGEGAKVAIVTSRMGSIADNTSGGRYGYRMSKAAVNMAGVSLAQDLKPKGVAVALLHPGYVSTDMTGNSGQISPETAAKGLIARIDDLTLETTGTFWHQNGETLPW